MKEPLLLADVICERTVPYEGYTGLLLMIFQMFPKLRGYRSYEGYAGLLLGIFSYVPKVTRLQKLRRLRWASVEDFPSCPKSYEVTKVTMLLRNFQICSSKSYKVSEVTKVTQGFCWDIFPREREKGKRALLSPKLRGYKS